MHLGPVIATAMAAAALAAAGARCETFDDFSSNTLDTSRWEHLGGQVHFAMHEGRLEFPCVAGAADRLTARLAVVPGFYMLEFTDYASTCMNQTVTDLMRRGLMPEADAGSAPIGGPMRIDPLRRIPVIRSPRPLSADEVRALEDE